MKNLVKKTMMAVAAVLGMGWATTVFAAGGDVWSIMRCDENGVTVSDLSPVGVKEWIYFRVRLWNGKIDESSDNYYSWEKVCFDASGNRILDEGILATAWASEPPRIGIFAAGMDTPVFADFHANTSTNKYFSDFVFKYHVEPGDFALPVDIAVQDDAGNPVPSYSGDGVEYYFDPTRTKCTFRRFDGTTLDLSDTGKITWSSGHPDDDIEVGNLISNEKRFYNGEQTVAVVSGNVTGKGTGNDFSTQTNFKVETVHFGDSESLTPVDGYTVALYDEEAEGTLIADTTMDTPRTFYVWSDNDAAVKMRVPSKSNANVSEMEVDPYLHITTDVATVTLVNDAVNFRFYAASTNAGPANLILSPTPHYVYSKGGTKLDTDDWKSFIKIPITITKPNDPEVSVKFGDASTTSIIATGERYPWSCTNITVRMNVQPTKDLEIQLTPSINGVADESWRDYVFFSTSKEYSGANRPSDAEVDAALRGVISAGSTDKSFKLYVYAMRSDAQSTTLTLTPTVLNDTEDFVKKTTSLSANIYSRATVEGPVGLKAIINKASDFIVRIKDAYADEQQTSGYRLEVRLVAGNEYSLVSTNNLYLGSRDADGYYFLFTDEVRDKFPQITFTGENQTNSEFRVISPIGRGNPDWVPFTHAVEDYAVSVDPVSGFSGDDSATEGQDFKVRFASGILPVSDTLYCYLVRTGDSDISSTMFENDTDYDIVVCDDNADASPKGYPIKPGEDGAEIVLRALTAMKNVEFETVFLTSSTWDSSAVYPDVPSGTFSLTVANISAAANELWVYESTSATKVLDKTTGGALTKPVLAEKSRAFRVRINDTDYDKANGMRVKWTVQQDVGGGNRIDMPLNDSDDLIYYFVSGVTVPGKTSDDPEGWFEYTFPVEGTYYVTAEIWDATDDPGADEDAQYDKPGSTITAVVTASSAPDMHDVFEENISTRFTGLVDYGEYYALTEGQTTRPVLDFTLPDPDTSYRGKKIKAQVTIRPASATETNPGWMELNVSGSDTVEDTEDGRGKVYTHEYPSITTKWTPTIKLDTLDGNVNRESNGEYGTAGWVIEWKILVADGEAEDPLPLMGMLPSQYWKETTVISADKPIKILNRAPVPSSGVFMYEEDENAASYTNLLSDSSIEWGVSDVLADRTSTWNLNGSEVTGIWVRVSGNNVNPKDFFATAENNYGGSFKPDWINAQVEGTVQLRFQDKDGGYTVSRTYIKPARPTKLLRTVANQPSGGNSSIPISVTYANADGVGFGHTYVTDGAFEYAEAFKLLWDCGTRSSSATVYAYGYRHNDIDNGAIATTLRDNGKYYDVWISPQGNHDRGAADPTSDDSCYHYNSSESKYDSFFYGWITATDTEGSDYTFSANPERSPSQPSWMTVDLPTEKNGDKDASATYKDTYVEAVFSREFRNADQLGDINYDGIPDHYMVKKWKSGIILAEPDGAGGELFDISTYNDDADYFPAEPHDGTSAFIPSAVSGWSSSGQPFTAIDEIRGYGVGLNFGMFQFNNEERATYGWLSNVEMNTIEKQALLRHIFERRADIMKRLYTKGVNALVKTSTWDEEDELGYINAIIQTLYYNGAAPESASVADSNDRLFWVSDEHIAANTTADVPRTTINEDSGEEEEAVWASGAWLRTYTPNGSEDPVTITNYLQVVAYTNETKLANGDDDAITYLNPCDLQTIDNVDTEIFLWTEKGNNPNYLAQQAAVKAYIDYTWRNFDPHVAGNWGWTCENRTDPTVEDTDGDGMPDGYEYWMWYSAVVGSGKTPLTGSRFNLADIESYDNVITADEIASIYNPNISRNWLHTDTDNDGIYDMEEFLIGTSPLHWDTDRDGLSDLYEVMYNINPLSAAPGQNGTANSDGDYMAYFNTSGSELGAYTYAYVDTAGDYWLLDTLYEGDYNGHINTNKTSLPVAGRGFKVKPFNGSFTVPTEDTANFLANNLVEFTEAAPLNFDPKKTVALHANKNAIRQDSVKLYHHQVHNYFGWDPRTAWFVSANGTLSSSRRWFDNGEPLEGGLPQNTAAFSAKDEFLLLKYRYIVGLRNREQDEKDAGDGESNVAWVTGSAYQSAQVIGQTIYNNKPQLYSIVMAGTTNPSANYDATTWGDDPVSYARDQHGADTDGDGVPDGWELYIGVDPNRDWTIPKGSPGYDTLYHDSGNVISGAISAFEEWQDGLGLAGEYAGTDTCDAYSACPTIYANHPSQEGGLAYRWKNKLFPTDPRNRDTDGDGLSDGEERGASWSEAFTFNRWGQSASLISRQVKHFAIYGNYDIGDGLCVRGGGMNPCSIDTDEDGLPDPWEKQYAGILCIEDRVATEADGYEVFVNDNFPPEELYNDIAAAIKAFGLDSESGYNVIMGMDPTRSDSTSSLVTGDPDRDWDGDGLQNWQEYLVQAMRHFRYDDSRTPLLGRDCPAFDEAAGEMVQGQWNGDKSFLRTSYMTPFSANECQALADVGYPNFARFVQAYPDYLSILGYFADPPKAWDHARIDLGYQYMLPPLLVQDVVLPVGTEQQVTTDEGLQVWSVVGSDGLEYVGNVNQDPSGRYTALIEFEGVEYNVIVEPLMEEITTATHTEYVPVRENQRDLKYVGTDPRLWDTDYDGMDDYYELFHGLNPLLGSSAGSSGTDLSDVIGKNIAGVSAWRNAWVGWENLVMPPCDPMRFPWMMGTQECDADGDGLSNAAEGLYANLTSPNSSHTDPTPLWMTDTSVPDGDDFELTSTTIVTNWAESATGTAVYTFKDGKPVRVYNSVTTNTVVEAVLKLAKSPSYTSLYYNNEVKNSALAGLWIDGGEYLASFEENEGYDSDNDWRTDSGEIKSLARKNSDPQDFSDPSHRQSIWFGGKDDPGAAISYAQTQRNAGGSDFFKQFTVEAWIKPDEAANGQDQYIVSRASFYGPWDLYSWEDCNERYDLVIRMNFALGLDEVGRVFAELQDATENTSRVTGEKAENGKWIHLAATYDGKTLTLYRDGVYETSALSALIPANGVVAILQNPQSTLYFPVDTYRVEPSSTILGARAIGRGAFTVADAVAATSWEDVATDFYKGRVSEVRTWDGARTAAEIAADYNVTYSVYDVEMKRLEAYAAWRDETTTRNDTMVGENTGLSTRSAELVQYYNMSTLPGATDAAYVRTEPTGFVTNVLSVVRDPDTASPVPAEILEVGWWSELAKSPLGSTVYTSRHVVPWMQNMVSHLPRLCGALEDSVFWSEHYAGWSPSSFNGLLQFTFPNTLSLYNLKNTASEDAYLLNKLTMLDSDDSTETSDLIVGGAQYLSYRYDSRMTFNGITDLVPLGSAFAKRSDDYWDGRGAETAWQETGKDTDANDLPDWWEAYARRKYGASGTLTPDTEVTRNGVKMSAYEAYLRDIAEGMLPTREVNEAYASIEDYDKNGIPDWWQELYGVEGDSYADDDHDGLSNYTEFLLSEFFNLGVTFSPVNAKSVNPYDSDYFFKIGQLYVGEIFTDHDFMEDTWEDKQSAYYTTRYAWDARKDYDEDGWSNFAECRHNQFLTRIFAPEISHLMGREMKDMPIPIIELTLRYNDDQPVDGEGGNTLFTDPEGISSENQVLNEHAHIIVQTYTRQGLVVPDATFVICPGEILAREVFLGAYTDNIVRGHIAPGYLEPNSLAISVMPFSSDVLKWEVYERYNDWDNQSDTNVVHGYTHKGSYDNYLADVYYYGSDNVKLLSATPDWDKIKDITLSRPADSLEGDLLISGVKMGTVNIQTGEFALDMSKLEGAETEEEENTVDFSSMVFRLEAFSVVPTLQKNKLTLYLGEPNNGYVREGKNTIVAYIDNLENNIRYTVGEPLGMTQVDIGWHKTTAEIEMTDDSPIISRADLTEGYTDRVAMWGIWDGDWTNLVEGAFSGGRYERVRVIRTLVNGSNIQKLGIPDRVIFDKAINIDHRPFFYEGDVLEHGALDLDWDTFESDVVDTLRGNADPVSVTYRVVLGNGTISSTTTNNLYPKATVRTFDSWDKRTLPTIREPGPAASVEFYSRPTFKWAMKMENPLTPGVWVDNNSYTAFKVQVRDGSTVIYDTGIRRAPAPDLDGVYKFEPDVYAGDLLDLGKNYTWRVSMYNAKFRDDAWSAEGNNTFQMNALTNTIGTIKVCAKYYGPANVLANGEVRIEAFTTPDFSGDPIARTYVRNKATVSTTGVAHTLNATLIGLHPGKYYVRGYIDMNTDKKGTYGTNRKKEDWESWGYVCQRDGTEAGLFMPTTIVIDPVKGNGTVFDLCIEDVDTNGNCLPDAWEMVQNKGKLDNGSINANDMLDCDVVINQAVTDNLQNKQYDAPAAALAAYVFSMIGNSGVAALIVDADVEEGSSYGAAVAGALGGGTATPEVEVEDFSVNTDNVVSLKVVGKGTGSTSGKTLLGASEAARSIYGVKGAAKTYKGVVKFSTDLTKPTKEWEQLTSPVEIEVNSDGSFETKQFEFTKPNGAENCYFYIEVAQEDVEEN